jgi:hypothetical protein
MATCWWMVSDRQLPWPYGHKVTGYAVTNLQATLARARAGGGRRWYRHESRAIASRQWSASPAGTWPIHSPVIQ